MQQETTQNAEHRFEDFGEKDTFLWASKKVLFSINWARLLGSPQAQLECRTLQFGSGESHEQN